MVIDGKNSGGESAAQAGKLQSGEKPKGDLKIMEPHYL